MNRIALKTRPETTDDDMVRDVFKNNCYKLSEVHFSDDPILIDIGSHLGSFVAKLNTLEINNPTVYGYEACLDTFKLLKENTKHFKNVHIYNKAVWRSDTVQGKLRFSPQESWSMKRHWKNYAAGKVVDHGHNSSPTIEVHSVSFDAEVTRIFKHP